MIAYHFHQLYEAGRVVKEIAGLLLTTNSNRICLLANYHVGATIVRTVVGNFNALVAQLYRAIRFYRKGWGLESLRVYQFKCLHSIKVLHIIGNDETQERYLLEAPFLKPV